MRLNVPVTVDVVVATPVGVVRLPLDELDDGVGARPVGPLRPAVRPRLCHGGVPLQSLHPCLVVVPDQRRAGVGVMHAAHTRHFPPALCQ